MIKLFRNLFPLFFKKGIGGINFCPVKCLPGNPPGRNGSRGGGGSKLTISIIRDYRISRIKKWGFFDIKLRFIA
jgi:hypothetical protein